MKNTLLSIALLSLGVMAIASVYSMEERGMGCSECRGEAIKIEGGLVKQWFCSCSGGEENDNVKSEYVIPTKSIKNEVDY